MDVNTLIDKLLNPQTFAFAVVAYMLIRMDSTLRNLTDAILTHVQATSPKDPTKV